MRILPAEQLDAAGIRQFFCNESFLLGPVYCHSGQRQRTPLPESLTWFGSLKHGERRRSGRKLLTQDFERLPPSAALAVNRACPEYVEILCGSLAQLPSAIARLDATNRRNPAADKRTGINPETASVSTRDRHLVCTPALERLITAAALNG